MGVFKPILLNTQSGGQIARALLSGDLGPNAISSGNIASGAVTPGTLSSGAVQSGNLGNAAVNSGNIGPNAVVSGNIASGAVTPGTLSSGAVTSGGLGNNAVNSGNINSGAVTPGTISSGAVTSGDMGDGAVVSGSVASGQIGLNHLASGVIPLTTPSAQFVNDPNFLVAAEPISGGYCVALNASGLAVNAQSFVPGRMPAVGIEASGALSGGTVSLFQEGRLTTPQYSYSGNLGVGAFVGGSGLPVVTPPSASGQSVQRVGATFNNSGVLVALGDSTLIADT